MTFKLRLINSGAMCCAPSLPSLLPCKKPQRSTLPSLSLSVLSFNAGSGIMTGHNATVEDSSPLVVYRNLSLWVDSPITDPDYSRYSGPSPSFNSFHITNASTTVDFPFHGSAIHVFGSMGPAHGAFTVTLTPNNTIQATGGHAWDSAIVPVENTMLTGLNAQGNKFRQLLYSRTGLDRSVPHLISITNSGQGEFILDYFVVETEVGQPDSTVKQYTLDDAGPAFTYPLGPWDTDLSNLQNTTATQNFTSLFNNGTQHYTNSVGSQATLTFRGSGVSLYGQWYHGGFFVHIDDRPAVTIQSSSTDALPGTYDRPRELIFTADGLDECMHTISVTNNQVNPLRIDYAIVSTADPENLDGMTPPPSHKGTGTLSKKQADLIPIIGGAMGGALFLSFAVLWFWLWRRQRKRRARERVAVLNGLDDGAHRDVHTWVPPRPDSQTGRKAGTQSAAGVRMSSLSGLFNDVSPSSSVRASLASTAPASAFHSTPVRSSGYKPNGDAWGVGRAPSQQRRREMEAPPPGPPRHVRDSRAGPRRSGTDKTLPPIHHSQWESYRSNVDRSNEP